MLADFAQQSRHLCPRRDGLPQQRWREVANDHVPCALDVLLAVIRLLAGNALAPAFHAVTMHGNQDDAASVGAPKARLEEMDERHLQFANCDGFNLHTKKVSGVTCQTSP